MIKLLIIFLTIQFRANICEKKRSGCTERIKNQRMIQSYLIQLGDKATYSLTFFLRKKKEMRILRTIFLVHLCVRACGLISREQTNAHSTQ